VIGIEPRRGHGGDRGAGTGNRHYRKPCRAHRPHEARPWIADRRRAGITDQRHAAAGAKIPHDLLGPRRLVVFVERDRVRRDAEMPQQHAGHPRILGRDHVRAAQDVDRPQRQIAQISDRCGNHI
jgi:hypothetical protein